MSDHFSSLLKIPPILPLLLSPCTTHSLALHKPLHACFSRLISLSPPTPTCMSAHTSIHMPSPSLCLCFSLPLSLCLSLSLCLCLCLFLSLSHTHTHTHIFTCYGPVKPTHVCSRHLTCLASFFFFFFFFFCLASGYSSAWNIHFLFFRGLMPISMQISARCLVLWECFAVVPGLSWMPFLKLAQSPWLLASQSQCMAL